jgi:hypothetical protein
VRLCGDGGQEMLKKEIMNWKKRGVGEDKE